VGLAIRRISIALALLVLGGLLAACGSDAATTVSSPPITASVLIEAEAGAPQWFRDIEVGKGIDGYELLLAATGGDIDAAWFAEFRAHLVKEILGVAPEGNAFWGIFVWNENTPGWEPLPVGADLFSVKEGHVMGWALVEFDPDSPQLPVSLP
jgi:hypothetical protein